MELEIVVGSMFVHFLCVSKHVVLVVVHVVTLRSGAVVHIVGEREL